MSRRRTALAAALALIALGSPLITGCSDVAGDTGSQAFNVSDYCRVEALKRIGADPKGEIPRGSYEWWTQNYVCIGQILEISKERNLSEIDAVSLLREGRINCMMELGGRSREEAESSVENHGAFGLCD